VRGAFAGGNLDVFCKIVDLFQRRDSINALNREVRNYATLQDLQSIVIPRVRGYYDIWGLLRLLALEDVGTTIPEDGPINTQTRTKMKSALSRIHSAGYVHGDIARRNFCKKANVVFLVDLETLAPGSPVEMEAELAENDAL
jgi:tRNA A-37 threonylcarbamoyl transferase component Bud32